MADPALVWEVRATAGTRGTTEVTGEEEDTVQGGRSGEEGVGGGTRIEGINRVGGEADHDLQILLLCERLTSSDLGCCKYSNQFTVQLC